MERKISYKVDAYIIEMKDALSSKIRELGTAASAAAASASASDSSGTPIEQLCKQLTTFVYEYEKLKLTKEDFMKRKRVKNTVPIQQRCLAKRANGEQCTRKKKEGCDYCGTHTKGVPCSIMDDVIDNGENPKSNPRSVLIRVQNVR